ncbi:MAG: hypothetical protein RIQ33_1048 [Bacteroidota bacterium]|jgi:HTH-type transcriptional regulator/antitoxin HigA
MLKKFNKMELKIIKTERDYQKALKRLDEIFDAKPNSAEGNELEILSLLIERYEQQNFPIDFPNPIEAIKFRMEQMGYKQKDLAPAIGFHSRISEVLNKKRKLTLEMVRQLNALLHIPTDVLIRDYK